MNLENQACIHSATVTAPRVRGATLTAMLSTAEELAAAIDAGSVSEGDVVMVTLMFEPAGDDAIVLGAMLDEVVPGSVMWVLVVQAAPGATPALIAHKKHGENALPVTYDRWFRAQVQEAIDDPRPSVPHDQVMAEMRGIIESKAGPGPSIAALQAGHDVFRRSRILVAGGGSSADLIATLSKVGIDARLGMPAPAPAPVEPPPVTPLSQADLSRIRAAEEKRARRAAKLRR